MNFQSIDLVIICFWIFYFSLHSLLASNWVKQLVNLHFAKLHTYYRLTYNLIAIISLLPILYFPLIYQSQPLWQWDFYLSWLMNGLAIVAILGFLWTLKFYDMGAFTGLRRVQAHTHPSFFVLSPVHRYVRHPWYFFALVIIWTRNFDSMMLINACMITAYFIIGSRLEDQKLEQEFGESYRAYRQKVPGLFPWFGRVLSKEDAVALSQR